MRVVRHIAKMAAAGVPLSFLCAGPPPSLSRQPLPQRVASGHRTTLNSGSGDLRQPAFSWEKFGVPIPDQATPTFEIRNARSNDAGRYQVVASNLEDVANEPVIGEMASDGVGVEVVMRPEAPGVVDLDFDDVGLDDAEVRAVVPSDDGGVLVVGKFTHAGTRGVLRQRADGSLDPAFNVKPGAGDGVIHAAVPHAEGWIVGGSFQSFQGIGQKALVRLMANGQMDRSFVPPLIPGSVRALATQEIEGELRIMVGLNAHPWLIRLHEDGQADQTFSANIAAAGLNDDVYALAVQPNNGAVIVGGAFSPRTNSPCVFKKIGRVLQDGQPDPSPFRLGADADVLSIAVDHLGRFVVGGKFIKLNGSDRRFIARVDSTGEVDQTLDLLPRGTKITAVACFADGSLIVSGDFTRLWDRKGLHKKSWQSLARLNKEGLPDASWRPTSLDGAPLCLAVGDDDRLFVGGEFSQPHEGVVALRTRPFTDPPRLLAPVTPQELTLGMGGSLYIHAQAPPDATYVWYRSQRAEPVATTRTGELRFAVVDASDADSYAVAIVTEHHTVTTGPFEVRVSPRPAGSPRHWRAAHTPNPAAELHDVITLVVPLWLPKLENVEEVRVTLALNHQDTKDLIIHLVSPGGTRVSLAEEWPDNSSGQDFDFTVFADQAAVPITDAPAPFTGTYRSSATETGLPGLAAVRGEHKAGNWSIVVSDDDPDGNSVRLLFAAIDIFGPHPPITAEVLATRPCPEVLPELSLEPSAHRAWLYHWLPDAAGTPSYERAFSLSDWRMMSPTALYRLRRNNEQTAMAELLLPDEPVTPAGFFRAKW